MKHKMVKKNGWIAYCKNPCCVASLEGGIVEEMSTDSLQEMFDGECPAVSGKGGTLNGKKAIKHILSYGKKEINDWKKAITFWSKYL